MRNIWLPDNLQRLHQSLPVSRAHGQLLSCGHTQQIARNMADKIFVNQVGFMNTDKTRKRPERFFHFKESAVHNYFLCAGRQEQIVL